MPSVLLDWLRLIRASGLATIASNLVAVAIIAFYAADGQQLRWLLARIAHQPVMVLWVVASSILLYVTGMVWNDILDLDRDRGHRPDRPLSSGRIGIAPAYVAGVIAPVGAMFTAAQVEYGAPLAGIVLTLILLYDLGAKDIPIAGSVVMALVRCAHACFALLAIGPDHVRMLLTPGAVAERVSTPFVYPVVLGLYVLGLTMVSELEDRRRKGTRMAFIVGGALMALAVLAAFGGLLTSEWMPRRWHGGAGGKALTLMALVVVLSAAGLWLWRVGRPYLQALLSCRCQDVGPVVGMSLGGMILLDTVLATAAHPLGGVLCLAFFPLFLGLSRLARMD